MYDVILLKYVCRKMLINYGSTLSAACKMWDRGIGRTLAARRYSIEVRWSQDVN